MMDMSSGKMKQTIVDQVDGMETTLAHLFPEMTANIAGPVLILVYLFALDWRMALLSVVTIPVGMAFMMSVMGSYSKNYEGAVKTTQEMNGTIVEYIGGIEVIKAFNQGKSSYAKFADRVKANASYYYNWMKKSQFGISTAFSIVPAALIAILPVGWLLYRGGSLPVETFITVIILSLGIAGPLLAAMNFVDTLAQVGTTAGAVEELLMAEEQRHGEQRVRIPGADIRLSHVSFRYHEGKDILRDVSLSIPAGGMTALVGPSGGGKSTIAKLIAGFWDVKEGTVAVGGAHLSGGERQRIAIARAMLKDAPIVILDEATAYIDPENEAVIQKAIGSLVRGKTVLVIAHRLSTIKAADQIVVVKDGQIEAVGKHEELRESCPLYEAMWRAHIGAKDGEAA